MLSPKPQDNLPNLKNRTTGAKNLRLTTVSLALFGLLPIVGVLLFDWKAWMLVFNFYADTWIIAFTLLLKYLVLKSSPKGNFNPNSLMAEFGSSLIFLLMLGAFIFYFISEMMDLPPGETAWIMFRRTYLDLPFSSLENFLHSPLLLFIIGAFIHFNSFRLNFFKNLKQSESVLEVEGMNAFERISHSLFVVMMYPAITLLILVLTHANDLHWFCGEDALLIPIVFVLVKDFFDVRAHIACNNRWIRLFEHGEVA